MAQIVALADVHAAVAQDVVRGDEVEVEMGQRPVAQNWRPLILNSMLFSGIGIVMARSSAPSNALARTLCR